MYEIFQAVLDSEEKTSVDLLMNAFRASGKNYLLRNEILQVFTEFCSHHEKPGYFFHSSSLGKIIHHTHEIIFEDENTWLVVRPWIGIQQVWRLLPSYALELMTPQALLEVRDRLVNRYQPQILEIDFSSFSEDPIIEDPRNIGQGLAFLNRHLCAKLLDEPDYWLEALFKILHKHRYSSIPLLINERIKSGAQLHEQVKQGIKYLNQLPPEELYEKFHSDFQELGFEPGWGNTASRARETLELLSRLIDTPEPPILEAFVSRIPVIFRVVHISIHGWVAQEGVVGRTETTGQVVYVLDQARSLEKKLREDIQLAGLNLLNIKPQVVIVTRLIPNCEGTQCNLRLEKIEDTENAWILRVPFQEYNPEVTNNWISKFEIWPYLEAFASDVERELLQLLKEPPNFIIGHSSDGNLVASLLARRFKVTQCNIAHSLDKPKYLFSNLYWQDLEDRFHFSAEFTADLISMNAADFIVTSSCQEIVGTPDSVGQYESYKCFTMPQLYHVIDGIDLFNPKFNNVPPGVDEKIFFPYSEKERDSQQTGEIYELLFKREDSEIFGYFDEPNKRPIFAIAPINSIKNLAGLAECFGNQQLQQHCNLILVTSKLHPDSNTDPEEAKEIQKLYDIIDEYHLQGHIRWLGMRLTRPELGEVYRVIADCQGIFVHFALFEAFGLTILEAMISGLPTFATQFGGSLEIIEDGKNGFHINPTDLEGTAKKMLQFINECDVDPQRWHDISQEAIKRIQQQYNWESHTNKLLLLAKIYGFWNRVSKGNREALHRYLETLFYLVYKPRAEAILQQHMHR